MFGNVIVVLILLFFIYIGYKDGAIRSLSNLLIYLVTSILAGFISDKLIGILYKFLPFLNFVGKSEGIKVINIIFWKLALYLILMLFFVIVIKKILLKTSLEDKIIDSEISSGTISKILGVVISFAAGIIITFNVCLILLTPNLNLKSVSKSKLTKIVMEKTPILSKMNANLYENEKWIINRLNEKDNTKDGFETVNEEIISHVKETKLVKDDIIKELEDKDKLVGTRTEKQKKEEKEEETTEKDTEKDNSNNSDDSSNDDENIEDNSDGGMDDTSGDGEFDEGMEDGMEDFDEDFDEFPEDM